MKQQFIDKWIKPVINSPKTTISALAAITVIFMPHHSATIAAAATAFGLLFAGDASHNEGQKQ